MKMTPMQAAYSYAVAQGYGHLWATLPINDGLTDTEEIKYNSLPHMDYSTDILCPEINEDGNVFHVSYHKAVQWEVQFNGNTKIEIHRPDRIVARVDIINDSPTEIWKPWDFILHTDEMYLFPDLEIQEDGIPEGGIYNKDVKDGYVCIAENPQVETGYMFERHLGLLVRPIQRVILLKDHKARALLSTIHTIQIAAQEDPDLVKNVDRLKEIYHNEFFEPAVKLAKEVLSSYDKLALPDHRDIPPYGRKEEDIIWHDAYYKREKVGWNMFLDKEESIYQVYKNNNGTIRQSFPVESEMTAIHATLLLRQNPELDIVEAVRTAILDGGYRPATQSFK